MPSGGIDFLKGCPKSHRHLGVLQQLQGWRAQQKRGTCGQTLELVATPAATQTCPAC